MDQIIFTEDFVQGVLWCFLLVVGLLVIFTLVSLVVMAMRWLCNHLLPECPDDMKDGRE